MKIQLQNTRFYPATGGIENYLYYAAETLLKKKHKPTILCSKHLPDLPMKDIYENIEVIRYPAYHLSKPLFAFNLLYYEIRLQEFIRNNSNGVDIIWARHPYCTYASCKALPKIPIIYIQATVWPYYLRYASKKINVFRKAFFQVQNLQDYLIEKRAMEMCNKIVVLSKIRMQEISDFYKFSKEKFDVVPPGIDLDRFKSREKDMRLLIELNLPKSANIILSVCRLDPGKNVEMLIKAFAKINVNDTYLVVVGDGSERLYLEILAKKLNIDNKVKFAGFRKDVERFYSIADVFVLPSIYEGFGHVYLEAMASGVPCIGLRSDYPRVIVASEEIIRDCRTGYLADTYSIEDLSEKVEKIISDEKKKEKMSEEAQKICKKEYSWDRHIERILELSRAE